MRICLTFLISLKRVRRVCVKGIAVFTLSALLRDHSSKLDKVINQVAVNVSVILTLGLPGRTRICFGFSFVKNFRQQRCRLLSDCRSGRGYSPELTVPSTGYWFSFTSKYLRAGLLLQAIPPCYSTRGRVGTSHHGSVLKEGGVNVVGSREEANQ